MACQRQFCQFRDIILDRWDVWGEPEESLAVDTSDRDMVAHYPNV